MAGVSHIKNDECPFCGANIKENELVNKYKDYVNSKINKMKIYLTNEITKFQSYKNNVETNFNSYKTKAQYLDTIFKTALCPELDSLKNKTLTLLEQILNVLSKKSSDEYLFVDSSTTIENINISELVNIKSIYDSLILKINDINKKVDSSTNDKTKRNDDYSKKSL